MAKFFPHLFILLSVMCLPACFLGWTEIEDATLTTAVVDEPYTFNLQSTHHNWGIGWRNDHFFKQTGGDMPPGVGVKDPLPGALTLEQWKERDAQK